MHAIKLCKDDVLNRDSDKKVEYEIRFVLIRVRDRQGVRDEERVCERKRNDVREKVCKPCSFLIMCEKESVCLV